MSFKMANVIAMRRKWALVKRLWKFFIESKYINVLTEYKIKSTVYKLLNG